MCIARKEVYLTSSKTLESNQSIPFKRIAKDYHAFSNYRCFTVPDARQLIRFLGEDVKKCKCYEIKYKKSTYYIPAIGRAVLLQGIELWLFETPSAAQQAAMDFHNYCKVTLSGRPIHAAERNRFLTQGITHDTSATA